MIIWFDLLMMVVLFFMGLCFYRSNGKGANLLSGYNMKTKEERSRFDEPQMCRIYGRKMMQMAIPFFFGAVIDLILPGRGCLLAWIVFAVLLILVLQVVYYENTIILQSDVQYWYNEEPFMTGE